MSMVELFRRIAGEGSGDPDDGGPVTWQGIRKTEGVEDESGAMTLEDFLASTGALMKEDVNGVFMLDPVSQPPETPAQLPGNGGGGGGGRGRKRLMMDRALQKQKRMIKNRESAARSRERKQLYTVELESLVTQLEEDNAQLTRHEEVRNMARRKKVMANVIPVTLKKRPRRRLRRCWSLEW